MSRHHAGAQLAFQGFSPTYVSRRPETTVMYRAVAGGLRTFQAVAESDGEYLPKHIHEEFEAYLKCGILAHGFLRLKCGDCRNERLVAFSCKKRGFCSSCGGRRMSESAAHLVESVFPFNGVRQWVLSFPMPIRYILARHPRHQSRVLMITHHAIARFIRQKAKRKGFRGELKPGAVTLIQRFGGSINLNVHFHMLFLEGGYYETRDGPRFWWVEPPTNEEVWELVARLAHRVIRYLKRQGYFRDNADASAPDTEQLQNSVFSEVQAASIGSRIATGERKGSWVRRIGSVGEGEAPVLTGSQCAMTMGFSLHAAVACKAWEREKLEKLCRYIARPAVAEERLSFAPNGNVVYRLKRPYSDGTSHLVFTGLEFVEKLAALIPQPRIHLTRYFGCLAAHSKIRSQIVPKQTEKDEGQGAGESNTASKRKPHKKSWAELLARVFKIDINKCPECGGEMKIIAAILETAVIEKILTHLQIPHKPPDVAPSRVYVQMEF